MIYIGDIDPIINLGNESNIEIYNEEELLYPSGHDYSKQYLTFVALVDGTFKFTKAINYSLDSGDTWVSLNANTNTPTVHSGETIMFKAQLTPDSSNGIGIFSSSGRFNAEGNPMSMIYGDNFVGQTSLADKPYAFHNLFRNNSGIRSAENLSLSATILSTDCYQSMFLGCSNLTTAPTVLPATTLVYNCYRSMFNSCSSLITSPKINATTLAERCCSGMFDGCRSLITAPELYATTLANSCYYTMFHNCSSLNYIKMLATDISETNCLYNWVEGVQTVSGTFVKAKSMNDLAICNISGIPCNWVVVNEGHDYSQDYLAFKALESGTFSFTNDVDYSIDSCATWTTLTANTASPTIASGDTILWKAQLNPNSSNGIGRFSSSGQYEVEGNAMSLLFDDNFIGKTDFQRGLIELNYAFIFLFSGSTGLTSAENLILPATTLANQCYRYMFYNCTSLVTAPELPATTMTIYCYDNMFNGCTNLSYIKMLATDISATNCLSNWVQGVSATGTFVKDASQTSLPSGASGIPDGWTVQNA